MIGLNVQKKRGSPFGKPLQVYIVYTKHQQPTGGVSNDDVVW